MCVLIQILIIMIIQGQLAAVETDKRKFIKSRTVTITHGLPIIQKNYKQSALLNENQEEYVLVLKKLIGEKLQRYFSETSTAVVVMSCCSGVQVHRRCLRDMFHAKEHRCFDTCPGCFQKVDRHVFAQSRSNYILTHDRKKSCDFCDKSLRVPSSKKHG